MYELHKLQNIFLYLNIYNFHLEGLIKRLFRIKVKNGWVHSPRSFSNYWKTFEILGLVKFLVIIH